MQVLRIVLGILLALVALFAGGCSVYVLVIFVQDAIAGHISLVDPLVLLPLATLSAGCFAGWLAYIMLRGPRAGPPGDGGG